MKSYLAVMKDALLALEADRAMNRSAWGRGVVMYAQEMVDHFETEYNYGLKDFTPSVKNLEKVLLNGAENWHEYSWGGSSLIYDCDIAKRLCSPSELKKTKGGLNRPNGREDWLDVQERALRQAFRALWHRCNWFDQVFEEDD